MQFELKFLDALRKIFSLSEIRVLFFIFIISILALKYRVQ